MSETREPSVNDKVAPEISSEHLPPVTYRDMPQAPSFWRIVGPGVILVAGAVGSGEFVLWPLISSQVGLTVLWAAIVGILLQYFLNTEVARYTISTGETAITGFARIWKPWGIIFATVPLIGFLFPGIPVSATTTLTYALGGGDVVTLTILGLLAIGIAFSLTPVIYQALEKFMLVVTALVFAFLILVAALVTGASDWGDAARGAVSFGNIPSSLAPSVLLAALVYAGSGGLGNLTVSNWIRDKNWGMGSHIARVVSPITGDETAAPSLGHFFPQTEENLSRWERWWKLAKREQFWFFLILTSVSITILSVISYATVFGRDMPEGDLAFIRAEGEALQELVAPWFGTLFWIAGFLILFSTVVGNLDIAARVAGDSFKVGPLRTSTFWSESKIYLTVIWTQVFFGIFVLLSGLTQPVLLITIQGMVGALVLFFSTVLLIWLNRKVLPRRISTGVARLVMMIVTAVFYGAFAAFVIFQALRGWLA